MLWRTAQDKAACFHDHGDAAHGHDHDHGGHDHGGHGHAPAPAPALARATRDAQARSHGDHGHAHEDHADHDHAHGASCGHDHGHAHAEAAPLVAAGGGDAHARAHAADIQRRFAGRDVTTGQIVMFGLTGGLIPCPASITVLLLCLQLKRIALGATLVLGFSVGLALTMVASGVVAAVGLKHLSKRMGSGRFSELAAKAPYFSGGLILLVGLYVGYQALHALV
jgi:ABC-type nickel/cobalt efflux system permease component RcnA